MSSFFELYEGIWFGWPGVTSERLNKEERKLVEGELGKKNCYPVFLSQSEIDKFYNGFCNRTLWPLFHYFTEYAVYRKDFWETYKKVNAKFAEIVSDFMKPGDRIWIHDYHLLLVPKILRERVPNSAIGFFLHIPFPSFEVFSALPWRKEILQGMLGADLIGFHTYDYVKCFLESVRRTLGYEQNFLQITAGDRIVLVDAFPMGIEYKKFAESLNNPDVQKEVGKIRKELKSRKIILSVDRLDYTKGIKERILAYDIFLTKNSSFKEKVVLILVVAPSRTKEERYMSLKKEIDELVGRINGKYGTMDWMPIRYIYRTLSWTQLTALYHVADIALITPLRDGMNLIAKEFMATKTDGKGFLILSEMAGAAEELGEALIVNPNNLDEIAEALKKALHVSEEEQVSRNRIMQKRLETYNIGRWAKDFLEKLFEVKETQRELNVKELTKKAEEALLKAYTKSKNCLFLLDYDGTLVPFEKKPERAIPDQELLELINWLAKKKKNEVVIVSGRKKETLDKWFGNLNIGLISDHGVWIRRKGKRWEMIKSVENNWKEEVRPILELYVDRTPGTFLEDKEFSLAWHYRNANPDLAKIRAYELKETIMQLIINLDLEILEGNKVIEIKNSGINKGEAALQWVSQKKWEFILAIGDDITDEKMFEVLPEWAYSIKVGLGISKARFNLSSFLEVRKLLCKIAER